MQKVRDDVRVAAASSPLAEVRCQWDMDEAIFGATPCFCLEWVRRVWLLRGALGVMATKPPGQKGKECRQKVYEDIISSGYLPASRASGEAL